MIDYNTFLQIINGSKQYEIEGTVLTITGYYTGDEVKIDLARITPEILEEIEAEPEDEYEPDDEYEEEW